VEWTKDIESTGEEDMGKWEIIAVSEKPTEVVPIVRTAMRPK
jgi:hypothetical protein